MAGLSSNAVRTIFLIKLGLQKYACPLQDMAQPHLLSRFLLFYFSAYTPPCAVARYCLPLCTERPLPFLFPAAQHLA